MKNVMRKMLMLAFVAISAGASASEELLVHVENNQQLVVEMVKVEEGNVLLLKNSYGEILYKNDLLPSGNYKTILDVKLIPEGEYTVSLEKESHIVNSEFFKTKNGVVVKEQQSKIVFKPSYKAESNKLKVFFNNPEKNFVIVEVYDSRGILVGSAKDVKSVINKTLDFSSMPAGSYTVNVNTPKRNFSRTFNLD